MRTIESKFTTISQFSQIFWDYLTIFTEDRWGLLTEIRRLDKWYSHRHSLWIEKWGYRITIASYQRLWNLWMKSQEKRRRKRRRADGGLGSSSLLNFSLKAAQVSVGSFRRLWIGIGGFLFSVVPHWTRCPDRPDQDCPRALWWTQVPGRGRPHMASGIFTLYGDGTSTGNRINQF